MLEPMGIDSSTYGQHWRLIHTAQADIKVDRFDLCRKWNSRMTAWCIYCISIFHPIIIRVKIVEYYYIRLPFGEKLTCWLYGWFWLCNSNLDFIQQTFPIINYYSIKSNRNGFNFFMHKVNLYFEGIYVFIFRTLLNILDIKSSG